MSSPRPAERARGEWLYRACLRLYPRHFRERYANDMIAFYRERVRAGDSSWFEVFPDLVVTAVAERFTWLHRDGEPAPSIVRTYTRRRENPMSILKQDLRYALRAMSRRPGFAAVILATLALGIGANAAIFTVVNGVLLRPLPFQNVERLVDFSHADPYSSVSEPEFVDYTRGLKAFAKLAAYNTPSILLTHDAADPVRTRSARVSRDFFDVLTIRPLLGRTFTSEEFSPSAKTRVTVISHQLWVQSFASDPAIVGKTLRVSGTAFTIIGVMPREFTFPTSEAALWTPWRLNPDSLWTRNNHYLRMVGLLAPGATLAQARSQVQTLDQRWLQDFPETYSPQAPLVSTLTPLRDYLFGPTRPYLLALLGAVGFILLIACVNVANLLLVRGESRRKELAIRTALGASRGRVARQLLTESMVFAILGAAIGVLLAWVGTRALVAMAPGDLPRADEISVDARVVLFTVAITLLTGVLFGTIPALRVLKAGASDTLREGGKTSSVGASRVARRSLVVAEIALAVVLLSGAGLLVRSLVNLQAIDLGFRPDGLLTMQLTMPRPRYNDTSSVELVDQVLARVTRLPGVIVASAVSDLPISGNDNSWSILIDGHLVTRISDSPSARPEAVTPDYFHAMGIRVLRGRAFSEQDRMGAAPVAVISEGMAKKLWPGVDPIGHTLRMFNPDMQWATIVGVVADVRGRGYQADIPPTMYFPFAQTGQTMYSVPSSMTLVVKASGDPATLATPIRRIVREADASMPVSLVATMERVVGDSIASRRFATTLLAAFAVLALTLAGIGIYGVIAYGVSQRRYEIGIRVAMGAPRASIVRLVVDEAGALTAVGVAIGVVGAFAVQHFIRAMLVGVTPGDLPTFVVVLAALSGVALVACVVPARRATSVSPTEALREG